MKNKVFLGNIGGWSQLFFLLFFTFIGFLVAAVSILLIAALFTQRAGVTVDVYQSPWFMRMAQLIQALCLFLTPALLFAYVCDGNVKEYLQLKKPKSWTSIGLIVLLIIIIQPFIALVGYYNQQIALPEYLASIEQWMKASEVSAEKIIGIFLADKSVLGIISNLFIIAVVAGLVEELFFRGCMQRIVQKIVFNKHAAIWITAIIFSVIHFQFDGFFPRLLLGALLGYLYVWSGSIWIPVIAHTTHNAINVALMQAYYGTTQYEEFQKINMSNYLLLSCFSLVFSLFICILIRKKTLEQ